jgi:hypothetical protein
MSQDSHMPEYVIYHGAPRGDIIGGPYVVQVLAIEPSRASRTVSTISGIPDASLCDRRALDAAQSFGARIASPMVAPLRAALVAHFGAPQTSAAL